MSGLSAHISPFSVPDKRIILKQSDQIVSRVPLPIFLDLIANPTLFCRLIKINCLHSRVQSLSNRHIPAPRVHLQSQHSLHQNKWREERPGSGHHYSGCHFDASAGFIHNNIEIHIITFSWQRQICTTFDRKTFENRHWDL